MRFDGINGVSWVDEFKSGIDEVCDRVMPGNASAVANFEPSKTTADGLVWIAEGESVSELVESDQDTVQVLGNDVHAARSDFGCGLSSASFISGMGLSMGSLPSSALPMFNQSFPKRKGPSRA